jgi:hypothetical protein
MWGLTFGDFTEDFFGHNLDNYHESLSLGELEGDQLFHRHKGRWVDARSNNFIEAHRLQDSRNYLGLQFIAVGRLKNFTGIQLDIGGNSDR